MTAFGKFNLHSVKPLIFLRSISTFPTHHISLTQNSVLKVRGGSSELGNVDWRFFVAGGICAACSHGITTPIDVVKTKMQTDPEKYTKGVLAAAQDIIKTEGALFLLSGLGTYIYTRKKCRS